MHIYFDVSNRQIKCPHQRQAAEQHFICYNISYFTFRTGTSDRACILMKFLHFANLLVLTLLSLFFLQAFRTQSDMAGVLRKLAACFPCVWIFLMLFDPSLQSGQDDSSTLTIQSNSLPFLFSDVAGSRDELQIIYSLIRQYYYAGAFKICKMSLEPNRSWL